MGSSWKPPEDQVITSTGTAKSTWKPRADAVITNSGEPEDNRRWDEKLAGGITTAMHAIDQPGTMLGIEQPEVNALAPQGDVLFNKAGEAVADFLGRRMDSPVVPALAGTAVSMANPQNWMTPEMPGTSPIPGKMTLQNAAQEAGSKSLGFTKRFLNKPGAMDKAKGISQTMLDQGVITNPLRHPFSSGTESMLGRTEDLAAASGKGIEQSIDTMQATGKPAFQSADIAKEIESQLKPKYSGGAYDAEKKVVQEIVDTVEAHGKGHLDFRSAQDLKEKLQELGKFNSNTDAVKANLYRRASGIVRDALDKSVAAVGTQRELPVVTPGATTGKPHALFSYNDAFGPEGSPRSQYTVYGDPSNPVFQQKSPSGAGGHGSTMSKSDVEALGIPITGREPRTVGKWEPLEPVGQTNPMLKSSAENYVKNKELYGKALQAEKALTNRLSSEQGNKNIGLTDTIAAGAELAAGNPLGAMATIGVKRAFERGYHATKASIANTMAKETFSPLQKQSMATGIIAGSSSARQDLHAEFIRRFVKRSQ